MDVEEEVEWEWHKINFAWNLIYVHDVDFLPKQPEPEPEPELKLKLKLKQLPSFPQCKGFYILLLLLLSWLLYVPECLCRQLRAQLASCRM